MYVFPAWCTAGNAKCSLATAYMRQQVPLQCMREAATSRKSLVFSF